MYHLHKVHKKLRILQLTVASLILHPEIDDLADNLMLIYETWIDEIRRDKVGLLFQREACVHNLLYEFEVTSVQVQLLLACQGLQVYSAVLVEREVRARAQDTHQGTVSKVWQHPLGKILLIILDI